ncbi:sensor histidine kinase [Paenibacillus thermotolerans]|uniref:sensor histidine kinase n=1 Tax=Paenibacillus thermotolerans TaxID=3027807 RepID=UPI002368B323|nr:MULTISPECIES: HAMP domain-containing sensor histidine kinase [unclassified Paenibacillus]
MTIRLRLTLWYSAVLAVTVVGLCIAIYLFVSYVLYSSEKNDMRALAQKVYNEMGVRYGWDFFEGPQYVLELPELNEFGYSGYFLQIVDRDGNIRRKNIRGNLPVPEEITKGGELKQAVFRESYVKPYSLLTYSKPILFQNQFVGVLQVATTINDLEKTLANIRTVLTLASLASVVVAATLGWLLARKALRPIEQVIGQTDKIEAGPDLDNRITYAGPMDEIGMLTVKINGMLGRIQSAYGELEEAVSAQKRFVSDASHELRTPLTTIRGNVELLQKMWTTLHQEKTSPVTGISDDQYEIVLEALRDIAGEAERMSRLVNDLLMLARADAGNKMRMEPVELLPLVEDVARKAQHLPRSAEWMTGDLSPLAGVRVMGDPDYLRQLLFIFIENAFKYTPSGEVELSALPSPAPDRVGIRIRDTGIGMDKEDVPRIFDRFYRADPSRGVTSGTGLGLSIARWIIDQHSGSVEVLTRKEEGTSFIIWLPVV